jgi:hypothetical protein
VRAERRQAEPAQRFAFFFCLFDIFLHTFLKFLLAGVDVMITIFFDIRQFSAEKWRFSQRPMDTYWEFYISIFSNNAF